MCAAAHSANFTCAAGRCDSSPRPPLRRCTQEVFGRFGTGAWNLLKSMAERAEQEGRVCKETFVHNTLLHLSVALCRGNCWVLRKGLHELTRATGRQFQRGLLHPTADLVA